MPSQGHAVRKTIIGTVIGGLIFSLPHGVSASFDTLWARLKHSAMTLFSLQLSDLPIPTLFLYFLLMFVLIGLFPVFQRLISRIEKYLRSLAEPEGAGSAGAEGELEGMFAEPQETPELYDFEVIVLTRLARAGGKGLSLKYIADDLHLDPKVVENSLTSLCAKGLVQFAETFVVGRFFYLSGKGREYSIQQGFIPAPRRRYWGKGP